MAMIFPPLIVGRKPARGFPRVAHTSPAAPRSLLLRITVLSSSPTSGQTMDAADIADAITYIVTRPRHVAVNEMLIRPTEQER